MNIQSFSPAFTGPVSISKTKTITPNLTTPFLKPPMAPNDLLVFTAADEENSEEASSSIPDTQFPKK